MKKFKNIALSLAVIAGVIGLLFGATRATWTAQNDNMNNTIAAGHMSVVLGALPTYWDEEGQAVYSNNYPLFHEDNSYPDNGGFFPAEFTKGPMWPGDERAAYLEIANGSDADIGYTISLANFDNGGITNIDDVLRIRFEQIVDVEGEYKRPANYPFNTYAEANGLVGRFTFAPGYDSGSPDRYWALWEAAEAQIVDGNMISSFRNGTTTISKDGLTPKNVALYKITITLDENAGNEYQQTDVKFNLNVTTDQLQQ
jgi:hypothetical protein